MNFRVDFWDEDESRLHTRWFKDMKSAWIYIKGLEKRDSVSSVTFSQILYEFER